MEQKLQSNAIYGKTLGNVNPDSILFMIKNIANNVQWPLIIV